MSIWHVGDVWVLTVQVTDPVNQALVKPEACTVTVTAPDKTTSKPSVEEVETGVYKIRVPLTLEGVYEAVAATTGTYQASKPATIRVAAG